ncbi:hypothetical protein Tco_0644784 [Tanacetum coccineum]
MGDGVISTARKGNDEFIKLVLWIFSSNPKGLVSEVTSVYADLECDMPITIPLSTTDIIRFLMRNLRGGENISSLDLPELTPVIDESTLLVTLPSPYLVVLGDEKIDLLLRDDLDTLLTGDREIDFNPSRDIEELERLLADDPVPRGDIIYFVDNCLMRDHLMMLSPALLPSGPPHRLPLLDPLKRFALGKWISYDLEDLRACPWYYSGGGYEVLFIRGTVADSRSEQIIGSIDEVSRMVTCHLAIGGSGSRQLMISCAYEERVSCQSLAL